jgi:Mn-dependent DtxR family transcriptional regulator
VKAESNTLTCWRDFEKNDVSHSAAHYLMAIDSLHREYGYARCTDVAERLEVTRGAASMAVAHLKKRELVTEDAHKFLLLTTAGRRVARQVRRNYGILARFFEEVLNVTPEVAQADACKMEHLVSLETGRRLLRLMEAIVRKRGKEVAS